MIHTARFQVRPYHIFDSTFLCVWDTLRDARAIESALWLTEKFAQEDAEILNERYKEGESDVSRLDNS